MIPGRNGKIIQKKPGDVKKDSKSKSVEPKGKAGSPAKLDYLTNLHKPHFVV